MKGISYSVSLKIYYADKKRKSITNRRLTAIFNGTCLIPKAIFSKFPREDKNYPEANLKKKIYRERCIMTPASYFTEM